MAGKKSDCALAMSLVLFLSLDLPSGARGKAAHLTPAQRAIQNQIFNSVCCVPNMSTGYTPRKLKNGYFKARENDCLIDIDLNQVTFGQMNGKPVAVAVLYDSEGGTGVFESILLYDLLGGKPVVVGSYPAGDRAEIQSLTVHNDGVRLISSKFNGAAPRTRCNVLIKRSSFDKAECVQYELSKEAQGDIAKLVAAYICAWAKKPLTPEQRQESLAICARHQKESAKFANEVRLALDSQGYGTGPCPLTFQAGKPILHVYDTSEKIRCAVDLSEPDPNK